MTSLDGLRALEQAASPGPWRAHDDHWIFDAEGHAVFAGSMLIPDEAAFVVAARNALPGLLNRVAAAEADRDALREAGNGLRAYIRREMLRESRGHYGTKHLVRCDCERCTALRAWRVVLAASVPSGPAAGPTTSKETR